MHQLFLAFLALAVVLGVAQSVLTLIEASSVRRHGVRTTGALVDTRYASPLLGRRRYLPVIELTTQEGQRVVGGPRTGRGIGQRVPWPPRTVDVVYDVRDPSRMVTPYNGSMGLGLLWPFLGNVLGLVALVVVAASNGLLPGVTVPSLDSLPGQGVPLFLGVMFTGMGALAVVLSIRERGDERRILASAPRVPGVIVGVHWIPSSDEDIRVPVIAFRTLDGVDMQSYPNGGSTSRIFRPGTPVTVAYDPADPRTIFTDANGSMGGTAWIGTLIGVVFAVVAIVMLVVLAVLSLSVR